MGNDSTVITVVEDRSVIVLENGREIPAISPETEIVDEGDKHVIYYDDMPICDLGRKKALDNAYVHPEPGYSVGRCKMIKSNGERCKLPVRDGWTVCRSHGAGRPSNPGGLSNYHLQQSRYAGSLPTRLVEKYDEFLAHPDSISMMSEMALIDTRIAEIVERLDTADTPLAWTKVKLAIRTIDKDELDGDDIDKALSLLESALVSKQNDEAIWKEISVLIEQRRRLSETERRRIIDAKQVMTLDEANRFMAYVLNVIQTNVSSPQERRAIADALKKIT